MGGRSPQRTRVVTARLDFSRTRRWREQFADWARELPNSTNGYVMVGALCSIVLAWLIVALAH